MDLGLRDRVVLITGARRWCRTDRRAAFADEGAFVALHHRAGSGSAVRGRGDGRGDRRRRRAGDRASARTSTSTDADRPRWSSGSRPSWVRSASSVTATSAYKSEKFPEIDDESWASVVDDLLGATFRTCRAVVPGMRTPAGAGSSTSPRGPGLVGVARATHYAAAKAGIIGLTASLAKELGPQGILVNAVAPTTILTVKDGVPSVPADAPAEMAKTSRSGGSRPRRPRPRWSSGWVRRTIRSSTERSSRSPVAPGPDPVATGGGSTGHLAAAGNRMGGNRHDPASTSVAARRDRHQPHPARRPGGPGRRQRAQSLGHRSRARQPARPDGRLGRSGLRRRRRQGRSRRLRHDRQDPRDPRRPQEDVQGRPAVGDLARG